MKNEPEINVYGDAILFTLNGKTPPDFESGLKNALTDTVKKRSKIPNVS